MTTTHPQGDTMLTLTTTPLPASGGTAAGQWLAARWHDDRMVNGRAITPSLW